MTQADGETGRTLRTQWFSHLRDLSDISLQRRKWLDQNNTNPHWSYIEFVCSYPDDDQLQSAQSNGWLTFEEARVLSEFRRVLIAHKAPNGADRDNLAVLNDPAWHAVVAAAQEATERMLKSVADPVERAMLATPAQ